MISDVKMDPKEFIEKEFKELLQEDGRFKYYRSYEFEGKQKMLKQYWKNAVQKFFKRVLHRSICHFNEIEDVFDIQGEKPDGLKMILQELNNEKDFLVIKKDDEFFKLNQIITNTKREQFGQKILNKIYSYFLNKREDISSNHIVIDVEFFKREYFSAVQQLSKIFDQDTVLGTDEFHQRYDQQCGFKVPDCNVILGFLVQNDQIVQEQFNFNIYYYLKGKREEDEHMFEVERQKFMIQKQIEEFEYNNEQIQIQIQEKQRKAVLEKAKKNAENSKKYLAQKNYLIKQSQDIEKKILFMQQNLQNLQNAKDNKNFASIYAENNKILRNNAVYIDQIRDCNDDILDLQDANKQMDQILEENLLSEKNELEESFENLENDYQFQKEEQQEQKDQKDPVMNLLQSIEVEVNPDRMTILNPKKRNYNQFSKFLYNFPLNQSLQMSKYPHKINVFHLNFKRAQITIFLFFQNDHFLNFFLQLMKRIVFQGLNLISLKISVVS